MSRSEDMAFVYRLWMCGGACSLCGCRPVLSPSVEGTRPGRPRPGWPGKIDKVRMRRGSADATARTGGDGL